MKTDKEIKELRENFYELFNKVKNVEIVRWDSSTDNIGISLIKEYPKKILFKPAKTTSGKNDDVVLVKIGFQIKDTFQSNNVVLYVEAVKGSRYFFKKNFIDYGDKDAPTKSSQEISKNSKQPVNLEETSRYVYYQNKNKIFDLKINHFTSPMNIFNDIYKEHIETIDSDFFQLLLHTKKYLIEVIDPINNFLERILNICFGKQIKKSDFLSGYFSPYKENEYADAELSPQKNKFLGIDFPISNQSMITFSVFITVVYVSNYFFNVNFFGLVNLFNKAKENNLFFTCLIIFLLWTFEKVIPYSIFKLINGFIRMRSYLITLRVKFVKLKPPLFKGRF